MDFASLGIRVDSHGVREGASGLDDLTQAATSAEQAAERVAPAIRNVGAASRTTAQATSQAAVATRQVLDPLTLTYRTVAVEQAKQVTNMGAAALSARQYSFALRQLPMQITDIVTGLVSGQPAYMVAIQQGGQLRDVFGGFGNAMRALGTIITPTRLAIGGLGLTVGLTATAFAKGQAEGFEFAKSITLTGNAAGTTGGQLRQYAKDIDAIIGTEANAADVLAKLASTGRVANDQLQKVALAAVQLQKIAGVAVEQTVKEFASLGDKPIEASTKLNAQYNYLSLAQLRNIRELEETGRLTEAAAVAQDAYAAAISARIPEVERNLGSLQRTAKATGGFFAEMWDAARGIGRSGGEQDRIQELQRLINRTNDLLANQSGLRAWRDERNGANDRRRENLARYQEELQSLDSLGKLQEQGEAERLAFIRQMAALDDAESKRRLQEQARQARDAEQLKRSQFSASLAAIQRGLALELSAYEAQAAELEASRAARLITEQEYYDKRRELIAATSATQQRALSTEIERLRTESRRVISEAAAAATAAEALTGERRTEAVADANRRVAEAQTIQIENAERIRDLQAEIVLLRAGEVSQVRVLGIEADASAQKMLQYTRNAREAAQVEFENLQRQQQRSLAGMFAGNRQREFDAGLNAIDDRLVEQRRSLEHSRRENQITEDQYRQHLQIIEEFHAKSRASYDQYWKDLTAAQASWLNGAKAALIDYVQSTKNVAGGVYDALSSGLRRAEDTLLDFFLTGKLGWKEFANYAIREILRIQLQMQLANLIGFIGGLGSKGQPMAHNYTGPGNVRYAANGGPVEPNQPYIVGERGPELRVFDRPGWIVPNHQLGGGGGVTIHQTNHFSAGLDQVALYPLLMQMKDQTVAEARSATQEDALRRRGAWPRV